MGCGSGKAVVSKSTLQATVKSVTSPEDTSWHGSISTAFAVAGGGSRAFAYELGVYRALHQLGLLDKIDSIGSVSGGTWLSCIYMFARTFQGSPVTTEQLLYGAASAPSELSMAQLQKPVPAAASGMVQGDSDKLLAELTVEFLGQEWEVWPHIMSRWLLRYFDELKSFANYLALDDQQVESIKARNPELEKKSFLTLRPDRRQAYVMCGVVQAPLLYLATNDNVVSLQMTADFVGSPFYPNNAQVQYQKAPICPCDKCLYKCCTMKRTVGGGFVESFAFGGAAPSGKGQMGGEGVSVGAPEKPFSLPYACGISSWAPGQLGNSTDILAEIGNIRKPYWPMLPRLGTTAEQPQPALMYELADGGLIDNSGILSQLQRKASRIVATFPAEHAINESYDWANATATSFDPKTAGVCDTLYVLFGYPGSHYNNNDQVFEQGLLLPLAKAIRALVLAGKPVVLKKTFKVLPNEWWGIEGNCDVEIVMIYNEVCKDFQDQLPADTQQELAKGKDGAFKNYPHYSTLFNNPPDCLGLTTPQVNLLAAQAEYTVKMHAQLLEDLLDGCTTHL
ncbi:unnamed protein product [Durusdinium trenchii]|uniref:Uncharacterized protein n=2 Tax=Durusdinium trenchii TaxID=1381693 RepID=A0ABP0NR32_9DINO